MVDEVHGDRSVDLDRAVEMMAAKEAADKEVEVRNRAKANEGAGQCTDTCDKAAPLGPQEWLVITDVSQIPVGATFYHEGKTWTFLHWDFDGQALWQSSTRERYETRAYNREELRRWLHTWGDGLTVTTVKHIRFH